MTQKLLNPNAYRLGLLFHWEKVFYVVRCIQEIIFQAANKLSFRLLRIVVCLFHLARIHKMFIVIVLSHKHTLWPQPFHIIFAVLHPFRWAQIKCVNEFMVVIKLQQNSNYVELAFALCICFVLCHFVVKYIELFGITENWNFKIQHK